MLKQRVIGALVLLALIIIFVPMLFNRQDDARKVAVEAPPQPAAPTVPATEVQPVQTPEAPPVVVVPDEPAKPLGKPQTPIAGTAGQAPTQNAPVSPAPAQSQPAAPVAKAPATPAPVASAPAAPSATPAPAAKPDSRLGAANLPNSWSVQLASLSSRPSADALQAKLRSQGYNAYVRTADGMNRVFVGPVIERSEADRLRDQLNKQNGVKGFVVRFQPERG
ncbi:MAG: cell division protein [Pseudomonas sp. PGPPP4]|uniref:SPOR domain-containing protein n=2 Tax=Pseudomonas TaxID=286 RepID=UPI000BCA9AFA|nr:MULTISPECIES: SPOR domain-containing protein [Pseudomonas]MDU4055428.1 SPOR domain-containing protein [Pseudomonas oryzihabitans]NMZ63596.1 SPOR domain-containing protein [Pseudomonas oryzihabitans]OYT85278.1 MAG: cell division protein [Pseudomonas sp. PGPPP4]QEU03611.1 SPOR domain-containing protein [Pseudomonas oryzihabitans]